MGPKNSILKVSDLHKTFGKNKLLKGIDLELAGGEFYALFGENGSGKSTLLHLLMGIELPDQGTAQLTDIDVWSGNPLLKNNMALVSEKFEFFLPLTLEQIAEYYSHFYPSWRQDLFDHVVHERKIVLSRNFQNLSRGQKMQFVCALALAREPDVIFVDEVTSVLDLEARNFFIQMFKFFCHGGGTVVMTTNILGEVEGLCDQIILLNRGKIQFTGTPQAVASTFIKIRDLDPKHPIFMDPTCIWSHRNSDGSNSYIMSREDFSRYEIDNKMLDRRSIRLDEIYVYFIKISAEQKEGAEHAA